MRDQAPAQVSFELDEVQLVAVTDRVQLLRTAGRLIGSPEVRLGAVDLVTTVDGRRQVVASLGGPNRAPVVADGTGARFVVSFPVHGGLGPGTSLRLRLHLNAGIELVGELQPPGPASRRPRWRSGRRRPLGREALLIEIPTAALAVTGEAGAAWSREDLERRLEEAEWARDVAESRALAVDAVALNAGHERGERADDVVAALADALNRLAATEHALVEAEARAEQLAAVIAAGVGRPLQPFPGVPKAVPDISVEATHIGRERRGSDTR